MKQALYVMAAMLFVAGALFAAAANKSTNQQPQTGNTDTSQTGAAAGDTSGAAATPTTPTTPATPTAPTRPSIGGQTTGLPSDSGIGGGTSGGIGDVFTGTGGSGIGDVFTGTGNSTTTTPGKAATTTPGKSSTTTPGKATTTTPGKATTPGKSSGSTTSPSMGAGTTLPSTSGSQIGYTGGGPAASGSTGPFVVNPPTPTTVTAPGKSAATTTAGKAATGAAGKASTTAGKTATGTSTQPALDTPYPRLANTMPQGPSLYPRNTTIPVSPVGPASAPVTAQELQDGWQSWQKAWQTADTTALSEAERVQYILMNRARAADLVPLRAAMAAEYEKAAADHAGDALRLGAMANTIALASLQECMAKARVDRPAVLDDAAVKAFLGRMDTYRQVREDVVAWAFRTMEQAVAADPKDTKARAYLFDRVITMMGMVPEYATECSDIGPWVRQFAALKPKLAALPLDNDPRKARFEISLDDFERTMTTLAQAADDRRAVRDLLQKRRESWNQKDQKTYAALFLPGSRTAQVMAARKMEDSTGFNEWQLDTEQPYAIWVAGDTASIEALTRYRDKDGGLHGYQISGLRARKTADGWRLE